MTQMSLKYLGDLQFEATHELSGTIIRTDAPVDNQGKGSSFSPTDLVATALAACMGTIMGIVARRDQIDLSGMTITVKKEMTKTPPRRIEALTIVITVPNSIKKENQEKLKRAAATCPVHHSIHPDIKVAVDYRWG